MIKLLSKTTFLGLLSFYAIGTQALTWSPISTVKYIRTYNGTDYSIGLNALICPNQKDYFYLGDSPGYQGFLSIALSALMSGKKVTIQYDQNRDAVHCYITGIYIE